MHTYACLISLLRHHTTHVSRTSTSCTNTSSSVRRHGQHLSGSHQSHLLAQLISLQLTTCMQPWLDTLQLSGLLCVQLPPTRQRS